MGDVKVWRMNDEGEYFAAETAQRALEGMAELYCFGTTPEGIAALRREYEIADEFPHEVSEEDLDRLKVNIAEEGDENDCVTFRTYLAQIVADGDVPGPFSTMNC
jgi:hypothetical protein